MKTYVKRSLLAAWLFGASLILGYTWYYRPDNFPPLPESVGQWIVTVSGARTPEDIADMALYLASDASRRISCQCFRVDGGLA